MQKKYIFIYITMQCSLFCFAQKIKTLNDTVFQKGDIFIVPKVIFENNRCCSVLQKDSLKPIAIFLRKNKNIIAEIGVHTDNRGTEKANYYLSEYRAKGIWNYLIVELKVDSNRLKYKGYGESMPIIKKELIDKTKTKEDKIKLYNINTRTELKIVE